MERVAFLIEDTGQRVRCLLNPESIEVRRTAGVHTRSSRLGPMATQGLTDDPLLVTGGGATELRLLLLFDLAVEGVDPSVADVRLLTRPLWDLAEGSPPAVRFIWGKSWNVPAVVLAASERLEQFDVGGAPRRSWLSLRLRRISEAKRNRDSGRKPLAPQELAKVARARGGGLRTVARELRGDGSGRSGERLDQMAQSHFGDPSFWRLIASTNNISNPLDLPAGADLSLSDSGGER